MGRVDTRTVMRSAMSVLAESIQAAGPNDPQLFAHVEAYAALWLLELEDGPGPSEPESSVPFSNQTHPGVPAITDAASRPWVFVPAE